MSNRNVIFVLVGLILIFFLYLATIFEIRNVADVDSWKKTYKFDSKDPYGAWVFNELLKTRFDSVTIKYNNRDTIVGEVLSDSNLYIKIGAPIFNYSDSDSTINEFAAQGNNVLLIGPYSYAPMGDSLAIPFPVGSYIRDSILNFAFGDSSKNFIYKSYFDTFDEEVASDFKGFSIEENIDKEVLGTLSDTLAFFMKKEYLGGTIYYHSIPDLFTNVGSTQKYYLEHFNKVMMDFDPKMVIVDHPSFVDKAAWSDNSSSPIQYVLSQQALKWAYYLLLGASLLFIIFRSKRRQRMIPLLVKEKNTSLEYVQTLANLFESQGQHGKIVPHLRKFFYTSIKSKYFIDEKNPDFIDLLTKKSKVDRQKIVAIVNKLDSGIENFHFNDDQIINLHRRLEKFYKKAK